ncbi:hypothetical protein J3458_001356 [Metarhizium acridum]|uniref:uncharacterized protein n=1 Tax=Metarhizium acridum TaxID=92637 RepID=UPI001C6AA338|nr:hypothetical protein J3458_001356 [Metarhizium acridum]
MPTASNSASKRALCSAFFVASSTIRIRSLVLAAEMTLTATTFALGGSLDDSRQIEELNLCAAIFENTRDGCECGERVRGNFRSRLGDF